MGKIVVPLRYIPSTLSKKDRLLQKSMVQRSRKLYKKHQYYTRKRVASYKHRPSKHVQLAETMYRTPNIRPTRKLAIATGCSLGALRKIVKKGEGAYYSSGSRPNQTPQSWGLARLASAVMGAKASAVDFAILEEGCNHKKRAYQLARRSLRRHGYGRKHTRRVVV